MIVLVKKNESVGYSLLHLHPLSLPFLGFSFSFSSLFPLHYSLMHDQEIFYLKDEAAKLSMYLD